MEIPATQFKFISAKAAENPTYSIRYLIVSKAVSPVTHGAGETL